MSNSEEKLLSLIGQITGLDEAAKQEAIKRQAKLAKPPGSLGLLEDISIQLAGITGKVQNEVDKTRIYVLAADNGVCEEGVSSAPISVTRAQAINLTRGLTGASSLAKHFGDEVVVVDMGIALPYTCDAILKHSIGKGTRNLYKEPAMTREQAVTALLTGIELATQAKEDGVKILGVGEMGIGNTTTSAAVLAALTGARVSEVTGRGGGITDAAFAKKKKVIKTAIKNLKPDKNDPIDVVSKVGGYDICAMAGVYLGAAINRLPVVIDGFISIVAALVAERMCIDAREYMIASHLSFELGFKIAAMELEIKPYLSLGMRLGEGSGCPIAFRVVESACAVMNDMATFEEAAINDEYLDVIRGKDSFTV